MKIPVLIIISFLLIFPASLWSQQVRLLKDIENRENKGIAAKHKKNWTKGIMTDITDKSVVINGKEYRLVPDTVIRYEGGKIIKNTKAFKAAQSANVSVRIHRNRVVEIVVERLELRH